MQLCRYWLAILVVPLCLTAADLPPVAKLLVDLIRIDTSNPPGNEEKIANFLAPIFREAGFEIDIIQTPQTGKAHFIARLRGDGSKKPIAKRSPSGDCPPWSPR